MKPRLLVPLLLAALLECCVASNDTTTQVATTSGPTTNSPTAATVAVTTDAQTTVTTPAMTTVTTPAMTTVTIQGMTTAPPVPTTEAGQPSTGATPTPANRTVSPSNGTTKGGVNATTAPPATTGKPASLPPTALPRTTSTPPTIWEVKGSDNKTCQKMQFLADITASYYNTAGMLETVTVSVPPTSNFTGDCSSPVEREFSLVFVPDGGAEPWTLKFFFSANATSKIYQLRSLVVQLSYGDLVNSTEKGQPSYNFISMERPLAGISAPSGKAFSCDSRRVQSDGKEWISVVLTQLRMQPFANEAGGDFGESVKCPYPPATTPVPTKHMGTWTIVGITFIVMFGVLFIATGAFCCYVRKHKIQSSDTYSLMETY